MSKRKHKVRKPIPKISKRSTKLWPIVWCTGEDMCIGVSRMSVGVKYNASGKAKSKSKVDHTQWKHWNSSFREGYPMDFDNAEAGDIILCPKCGEPVDFRLFPSLRPPEMCDVSKLED
jgi:hypothetical protein